MNVLSLQQQTSVIAALCEGMSIRATERLTGIHRDTIMRLGVRIGAGCDRLHDYFFRDLNVSAIQLDELWAFIGKKQKRLQPEDDPSMGDSYTFIALDQTQKAILSYRTGKRDGDNTELFLADLRSRILNKPMISSDGFRYYERAVRTTFGDRVSYGQLVKHFGPTPSQGEASRRYSPPALVEITRKPLMGDVSEDRICTSHVERVNLSVRMGARRFTRLTNGFSKKAENHASAVSLFVAHYNFCRVHERLRTTPAAALGLTDHPWSIAELIEGAAQGAVEPPPGRRVGRFRLIEGGRN
jgi:IS1 family transposase